MTAPIYRVVRIMSSVTLLSRRAFACCGKGRADVSSAVVHNGINAARLTITTPQISGARLFRWKENWARPQGAYYGARYYFPERYQNIDWTNIMQFKSRLGARNGPVWIVGFDNRSDGTMYLTLFYWLSEGPHPGEPGRRMYLQSTADLPSSKWVQIEIYLRQSADCDGEIAVWQDGVEIFQETGVRTKYPEGDNEWSVDNYSSGILPSPATLYIDDATIRLTRSFPVGGYHTGPSGVRGWRNLVLRTSP